MSTKLWWSKSLILPYTHTFNSRDTVSMKAIAMVVIFLFIFSSLFTISSKSFLPLYLSPPPYLFTTLIKITNFELFLFIYLFSTWINFHLLKCKILDLVYLEASYHEKAKMVYFNFSYIGVELDCIFGD